MSFNFPSCCRISRIEVSAGEPSKDKAKEDDDEGSHEDGRADGVAGVDNEHELHFNHEEELGERGDLCEPQQEWNCVEEPRVELIMERTREHDPNKVR